LNHTFTLGSSSQVIAVATDEQFHSRGQVGNRRKFVLADARIKKT
jgi:hypothetical protein